MRAKKWILAVLTVLVVSFIFIRSSMSAVESSGESSSVLQLFERLTSFFHIPLLFDDYSIRKLAHFTEFAVFGVMMSWTVREFSENFKGQIFKILFFLLAVPVTDETIQYFPAGRSAEVRDVLIDFGGALTGFLILAMCYIFIAEKKAKKKQS